MNLHIYKYSNYYNRMLKRESSFAAYGEPIHSEMNVRDFNPGDGVNTSHLFGSPITNYDGEGDYLIVEEGNEILSRWFIIDISFQRNGQWNINLRRDLLVDFYDDFVNAPSFIEKATLLEGDPLIFNSENFSVNRIKEKETLLKDETGCQWLVGYVTRQSTGQGGGPSQLSAKIKYYLDYQASETVDRIEDLECYKYLNKETPYAGIPTFDFFFNAGNGEVAFNSINQYGETLVPSKLKVNGIERGFGWLTGVSLDKADNYTYGYENRNYVYGFLNKTPVTTSYNSKWIFGNRFFGQYLYRAISGESWKTLNAIVNAAAGNVETSEIAQYANKVVKVNGIYYRTQLETVSSSTEATPFNQTLPQVESTLRGIYNAAATAYAKDYPDMAISTSVSTNVSDGKQLVGIRTASSGTVKLTLVPFQDTKVQAEIKTDEFALSCVDSPYDIITMPYSDTLKIKVSSAETFTANKDLALATMTALLSQESGSVKDVQLLPYCPLRQFIDENGNIDLTISNEEGGDPFSTRTYYVTAGDTNARLTPLMYCQYSSDSFYINEAIPSTNKKMETTCDMYRLCSPNYAAIFEFSPAKNLGVRRFNVDFNYKPYNPYIHINPEFAGLYGGDFDDPRGLICGGDFSISSVADAWEQYELQNKNYEKSFQRQIDNLEVQQKYGKISDAISIGAGTLAGVGTGAFAGAQVGGGYGAIAGAVIGGVTSAAGGAHDWAVNQALRAEALDYTKDMFGYQLDNIKAIPNTISKVTTINKNNKGFPVLEYYTCTKAEKEAFAQKIAWNGMSVGVISTPINYIGNQWRYESTQGTITSKGYIKGRIIRIETLNDDFHLLKSISDEFYKGVYIQ